MFLFSAIFANKLGQYDSSETPLSPMMQSSQPIKEIHLIIKRKQFTSNTVCKNYSPTH